MLLKPKKLNLATGGPLVVLMHEKDTKKLELAALDRIKLQKGEKIINVLLDTTPKQSRIKPGEIGFFDETVESIGLPKKIKISPSQTPVSIEAIRKKLDGEELSKKEIESVIADLISNSLIDIEVAYFVAGCYSMGLTDKEVTYLTKATVKKSERLKLNKKIIADKHCIGGVPNNRTSMLVTPILAAAGLTIPKTSSRAITSPSGTADTMEVLAKIKFNTKEIKEIMNKANGCLVWAGSLDISGADTRLIKVRHPLRLDPTGLLLASILSKKAAVGATNLLIDIPVGKYAKINTKKDANYLKKRFTKISRQVGINTKVIITDGSQPIGNGIGPKLEARDVLLILRREQGAPKDLEKKSIKMADHIFKLTKTKASAKEILETGAAYEQMKKIIKAQGGNPNITPAKIRPGKFTYNYNSPKNGKIKEINNVKIAKVAKYAGAPANKGAGVYLFKKKGERVKKGERIYTIYAENKDKLDFAKLETKQVIIIK
jgi:putative thymidine phosphorylase